MLQDNNQQTVKTKVNLQYLDKPSHTGKMGNREKAANEGGI
jgi:hypothetical protein